MPKKSKKGVKLKKETPELKRLKTRIRNLKLKLSESVPKTELDATRGDLEAKVKELESRLGVSILKEEAEAQLKEVTGKLQAEIKKLEETLANSVPKMEFESRLNEIADLRGKLSSSREHEHFVNVLREEGVEVILLGDILKDDEKTRSMMGQCPNLVYTRDIVSVMRAGSIVMRMKSKVRAKEPEIAKLALDKLGVPKLIEVSSPGTMEGGDLVYMSDETLLVGIGDRTNNAAVKQLLGHLKENDLDIVIAVPLPEWAVHLDGLLMFLDRDLCIIHKQSLTGRSTLIESNGKKRRIDLIDYLTSEGFRFIEVTDYERHMRATNLVAIGPRKAVGYAGIDRVKSLLIQNGVDLIEIEGSELIRGGGGPHCMTAPMLRD